MDNTQEREQDPPLWLAAATNTRSLSDLPSLNFPVIDLTPKGFYQPQMEIRSDDHITNQTAPDDDDELDADSQYEPLETQLLRWNQNCACEILHIQGDTPTLEQWSALAESFPVIRKLYIQTGIPERWNDEGFPSSEKWPLDLLVISDACGEFITTEVITRGQVEHLVFYLTMGLKFAGCPENLDDGGEDVSPWLVNTITGRPFYDTLATSSAGAHTEGEGGVEVGKQPKSRLTKLEILGNDAIETFVRFAVGHFEVTSGLEELRIRSLDGTDMVYMPHGVLGAVLPHLKNLKVLDLSLADCIYFPAEKEQQGEGTSGVSGSAKGPVPGQWLIGALPSSLETFFFRGSVSIAMEGEGWLGEWAAAFSEPGYLPGLKRVRFWLDQAGNSGHEEEEEEEEKESSVTEKEVEAARMRVQEVLGPVLRARGVVLVGEDDGEWKDPWFDEEWPGDGEDVVMQDS